MNRAEDFERLALAVSPGLQNFYVIDAAEPIFRHRVNLEPGTSLFGPTLHLEFKPILESLGRWRGSGPAIYVDRPDREFVAIALHELAHVFDAGCERVVEPTDVAAEFGLSGERLERILKSFGEQKVDYAEPPGRKPWHGHGANFIRFALHLVRRAQAESVDVRLADCAIAGKRYALSPVERYAEALADELQSFDQLRPLAELRAIEPPRAFVELFERDISAR